MKLLTREEIQYRMEKPEYCYTSGKRPIRIVAEALTVPNAFVCLDKATKVILQIGEIYGRE